MKLEPRPSVLVVVSNVLLLGVNRKLYNRRYQFGMLNHQWTQLTDQELAMMITFHE